MKYTIETIDTGCIETLTFQDGRRYYKRTEKSEYGCCALDARFSDQLKNEGFDSEAVEIVNEMFDGFRTHDFLRVAKIAD